MDKKDIWVHYEVSNLLVMKCIDHVGNGNGDCQYIVSDHGRCLEEGAECVVKCFRSC